MAASLSSSSLTVPGSSTGSEYLNTILNGAASGSTGGSTGILVAAAGAAGGAAAAGGGDPVTGGPNPVAPAINLPLGTLNVMDTSQIVAADALDTLSSTSPGSGGYTGTSFSMRGEEHPPSGNLSDGAIAGLVVVALSVFAIVSAIVVIHQYRQARRRVAVLRRAPSGGSSAVAPVLNRSTSSASLTPSGAATATTTGNTPAAIQLVSVAVPQNTDNDPVAITVGDCAGSGSVSTSVADSQNRNGRRGSIGNDPSKHSSGSGSSTASVEVPVEVTRSSGYESTNAGGGRGGDIDVVRYYNCNPIAGITQECVRTDACTQQQQQDGIPHSFGQRVLSVFQRNSKKSFFPSLPSSSTAAPCATASPTGTSSASVLLSLLPASPLSPLSSVPPTPLSHRAVVAVSERDISELVGPCVGVAAGAQGQRVGFGAQGQVSASAASRFPFGAGATPADTPIAKVNLGYTSNTIRLEVEQRRFACPGVIRSSGGTPLRRPAPLRSSATGRSSSCPPSAASPLSTPSAPLLPVWTPSAPLDPSVAPSAPAAAVVIVSAEGAADVPMETSAEAVDERWFE